MGKGRIEGIPGRGNSLSKGREVRTCNGYPLEKLEPRWLMLEEAGIGRGKTR